MALTQVTAPLLASTTGSGTTVVLSTSPTITTPTISGSLTASSSGITFSDSSVQTAAASPYVLKNRIINGAMVIDQRNAGASVSNFDGKFITDRFAGTTYRSSATAQQVSDAPTGYNYSLKFTNDSTGGSPTGGNTLAFAQSIEGYNTADLLIGTSGAKTVTLSFWVKSSTTGTFGVGFCNYGATTYYNSTRSYVATYTISAANTWEQKTITLTLDLSGSWSTTTGVGLSIVFDLGSGSNYNTTAGSWAAGAYIRTSSCVQLGAIASSTWQLSGVQLEIGSSATPFERRLYNQELANCQRYYTTSFDIGVAPANTSTGGIYTSSTCIYVGYVVLHSMVATPLGLI